MMSIQKILVPVDFSEASLFAAKYAASLALEHKARLYVLHVEEPFPVYGRIVAGSLEDVQKHRTHKEKTRLSTMIPEKLKNSITVENVRVSGVPVHRVIVEMAGKLNVDVIVTTAQDRQGLMRFFKINLTEKVIRDAPCSVFVVRQPEENEDI
jgi:nucleotide-binding universal stress UspA family protein